VKPSDTARVNRSTSSSRNAFAARAARNGYQRRWPRSLIHLMLQSFGVIRLSRGGLGHYVAPDCRGARLYPLAPRSQSNDFLLAFSFAHRQDIDRAGSTATYLGFLRRSRLARQCHTEWMTASGNKYHERSNRLLISLGIANPLAQFPDRRTQTDCPLARFSAFSV
jgi:hypothetical protein